jgi:hypothetical protein
VSVVPTVDRTHKGTGQRDAANRWAILGSLHLFGAYKSLMLRLNRLFSRFYRLFCTITGNGPKACLTN